MSAVALLLAAGRSRRFGRQDKLRCLINGQPMLSRSAEILAQSGADHLIAVLRHPDQAGMLPAGFQTVICASEMSGSLRAGVRAARELDAEKLLITLADMPHIPPAHLRALLAAGDVNTPAATDGPAGLMPPACFPASMFDALEELNGDHGAGKLLRCHPQVWRHSCPASALRDYDTVSDFQQGERC